MDLFKTTIVIWTYVHPDDMELEDLAREATSGLAYCSSQQTTRITDVENDPDWDGTEFFEELI